MTADESEANQFRDSPGNHPSVLRDPVWQFVAAMLALAAIVLTVYLFHLGRPKKELQVLIDTSTPLVDVHSEAMGDIEILYKGKAAKNVFLTQVRLRNSGNQAILDSDYSRNLSFEFDADAEVIDYSVTDSEPANIGMVLTRTSISKVEVLPVLLNPGDMTTIRFIVIRQDGQAINTFRVDGRMKEIKQVAVVRTSDLQEDDLSKLILKWLLPVLLTISSVITIVLLGGWLAIRKLESGFMLSRRGQVLLVGAAAVYILSMVLLIMR